MTDIKNPQHLKIALSVRQSFLEMQLDPAKVSTLNQANLIRNFYCRLVEYTPNGELVSSAAKSFEIRNNKVIFEIRPDLKSSTGEVLTAQDFYQSFKRLLILGKNTHGDLRHLLCGNDPIKNMHDECSGLSVKNNSLIISPMDSHKIKYLIPLLASVDFSVIPASSIDWTVSNLPIANYSNTSGAYYLASDLSDKTFLLSANKNSFYYSSKMPQLITIRSASPDEALNLFDAKQIDFLPATYSWGSNVVEKYKTNKEVLIHETLPINLWALRFTKIGFKNTTSAERISLGQIFKNRFNKIYPNKNIQKTNQMFPRLSEGSLTDIQAKEIEAFIGNYSLSFPKKIKLGIPKGERVQFESALSDFSWIEYIELVQAPWTLPQHEQPDFYLTFGDSSFFEDFSLISNQMSMGTFNLSKDDGEAWIDKYISQSDKTARLQMLRELHINTLKNGNIAPIGFSSFYSFAQNGWQMEFSKYYVGNPYWQIRWSR
ncbi:MAG: hypothetical protein ACKOX6_14190 [Bdellovibrio sp.]